MNSENIGLFLLLALVLVMCSPEQSGKAVHTFLEAVKGE